MDNQFKEKLVNHFKENISFSESEKETHSHDESWHTPHLPDAVIYPTNISEIQQAVKLCSTYKVPLIPFGVGTSLEGLVIPEHGGISLDLSRMNKILNIYSNDMLVTVEAGVTRKQLNSKIKDLGLFFPVDPGADATLGGMTATRASGTNAVRYGTMRENVVSLTAVMANGEIIKTAGFAKKSAAGYDLTHLFIGSEGTLGVIADVTLKIYGIPEETAVIVCAFPEIKAAVDSVVGIMQVGLLPARIEFLDEEAIKAINKYSKLNLEEKVTLFFEFHGSENSLQEQVNLAKDVILQYHANAKFNYAVKTEEKNRLWKARHDSHYAAINLKPGCKSWVTDVCVPISKLPENIISAREDLQQSFLQGTMVGHVGDGNFHISYLVDPNNKKEIEEAQRLNELLITRAIKSNGTCTGEHGVGLGKKKYLKEELGEESLRLMKMIKQGFDPLNIFNPGKIFDL